MISLPIAVCKVVCAVALAAPRAPVAVIEDIQGNPPGIQFMDYVEPGRVIKLNPQDTIVLGYLKSCQHETITGGTVTVGEAASDVQGGRVERSMTRCDGGKMLLTAELANSSAGAAFRAPPLKNPQAPPRPEFTLYGLSPVVEVKPAGTLVIERVDQPGERYDIALAPERMTRGAFLDLAKTGIVLTSGGIYRVAAGERKVVFKIDPSAASGQTPLVGRLIRLQPAN